MPTEDKCILAQAPSKSQATQTQGLFYASSNTITAKKTGEMWQKLIKTASQDKVLELSTYSPGKGTVYIMMMAFWHQENLLLFVVQANGGTR